VVPDPARKLPGRGVWVSLARAKVAEAMRKRLFNKGFDADIKDDPALAETTGEALRRAALGLLGMAKKAGALVAGTTKVTELLQQGRARLLIHARDAAADGRRKLDRLGGAKTEIIGCFSGAEMDLALGRENVIHAAVEQGGLAEKLLTAARRVERYEAQ
jgi:ribosomal protein L7Ae-like RNA K-turn-binding protein